MITPNDFTGITRKVFDDLVQVALNRTTTTYEAMGLRIGISSHYDALGRLLGPISERFYEEYGVMVSVIVVSAKTGLPGQGFANLAWNLKHPNVNSPNFYKIEMEKTWDLIAKLYSKKRPYETARAK